MTNGAQQNGIHASQFFQYAFGQNIAGFQIALAAQVVGRHVQLETVQFFGGPQHFQCLADYLRPGSIAGDRCYVV